MGGEKCLLSKKWTVEALVVAKGLTKTRDGRERGRETERKESGRKARWEEESKREMGRSGDRGNGRGGESGERERQEGKEK